MFEDHPQNPEKKSENKEISNLQSMCFSLERWMTDHEMSEKENNSKL